MNTLPVAVIGAGPSGLAAAAHLLARGEEPVVFETGATVGAAIREWGHVRLFSPWRYLVDREATALLEPTGWHTGPLADDVANRSRCDFTAKQLVKIDEQPQSIVLSAFPEYNVNASNGEVRAADACGNADARPDAAAARDVGAVDGVPVLVGQDDEIGLLQDDPDVLARNLLPDSPTEALVAGEDVPRPTAQPRSPGDGHRSRRVRGHQDGGRSRVV